MLLWSAVTMFSFLITPSRFDMAVFVSVNFIGPKGGPFLEESYCVLIENPLRSAFTCLGIVTYLVDLW